MLTFLFERIRSVFGRLLVLLFIIDEKIRFENIVRKYSRAHKAITENYLHLYICYIYQTNGDTLKAKL